MSKTKIVLDHNGIHELLRSQGVADFCEAEAAKRTRATGMEYVPDVYYGKSRVNAGGYDAMSDGDGSCRRRRNDKIVYTQRRVDKK